MRRKITIVLDDKHIAALDRFAHCHKCKRDVLIQSILLQFIAASGGCDE